MAFTKIVAAGINTGSSYTFQELNTVGVMTAGTVQVGAATTVHTTGIDLGSGNITSHNINSTGIITATEFVGSLTAPLGSVTATNGTFSTNLLALTKIGIGTDDPESGKSLHVFGDTNDTNVKIEATASGKDARLELIANSTGVSQIRLGDEASANPGTITYDHSNNSLSFRTNGTSDRLNIISNGNVGIGTDNPGVILDVRETKTAGSTQVRVYNTDNSNATTQTAEVSLTPDSRALAGAGIKVFKENADFSANADRDISLALNVVSNNSQSEALRIASDGSVGIGTDDPGNHKLHLYGETNSDLRLTATGDDIVNIFVDSNRSSADAPIFGIKGEWNGTQVANMRFVAGDDTVNKDDGYITFATRESGAGSSTERVRITSGGYVGINESSPIHQLSVGINTSTAWDSNKNVSNTTNNDFIGLNIDNIDSSANPEVGIMLQAGSSQSGQYTINCLRTGSNTADLIFRTRNGGSASREQLRIKSNGAIAVGIASQMGSNYARISIDCQGRNIYSGTTDVTKYGLAFHNDPTTDHANGIGFFNDDGTTIGGYIVHQDKGGSNSGDIVFGTTSTSSVNNPIERVRITSGGHVGINSSIPGSVVDIMGQTSEDAIVNIRSYDRDSAIKLWPSDDHDLDRWRMAFWENDANTLGNDYPDWMVDGYGRQFMNNNLYIGRTKTFADSPTNQYRHYGTTGPGVFIYNGVSGDDTNYSSYLQLRSCQTDTDDRNIIYYANAGTTTTLDYDAHQYFGVKANGRVQGKHQFFSGRVESDEGSPDSVYYSGRGGFYAYDTTSTAVSYLLSEAGGSSTTYSAFHRTSNNDIQWKHRTSDGRMYVDAGATTFNGADYAEYFEWSDGNTNNEDRAGYTVVLKNGNKIGIATAGDSPSSIIGVISGVPAIIGDGQDLSWRGKWLKDEFGREITTDVQYLVWNRGYERDENGNKVPVAQPNPDDQMSMQGSDQQIEVGSKLDAAIAEGNVPQFAIDNNIIMTGQRRVKNPDYNPDAIYVSREFRPEWSPVGLVGKLIVRKGQVMGDRWIKMKDINEQLEQWLVR